MTDAGSLPAAHCSATARLTYQRFPMRRAGSTCGISRRIFWQFELADPFSPTSPNHSAATCSTVMRRPLDESRAMVEDVGAVTGRLPRVG